MRRSDLEELREVLLEIVDRCDNALANAGEPELRRLWMELARRAAKLAHVVGVEQLYKALVGEPNELATCVTIVKRCGEFRNKTVEDLLWEGVIEMRYELPKLVRELLEKGFAEVGGEELSEALDLVRLGVAKLILVPRSWSHDPLFFKASYAARNDPSKQLYNLERIRESLEKLPEPVKKELLEVVEELSRLLR